MPPKKIFIIESDTSEEDSKSSEKKETINNPCIREQQLRDDRKILNTNINKYHADCELTKYQTIYKYFNPERKSTFRDLLKALMFYYKENKSKDQNFIISFESFLDMFEKDTMKIKNFKKQHVFEALCKILLMYDYDDGELGRNKRFYSSLEKFVKNPDNPSNIKTREEMINEDINVSSEGGVVDIFFKTNYTDNNSLCEWMCDCIDTPNKDIDNSKKEEYILIQNKYYSKEKSDIKNYDVTKIYAKATSLYQYKENIVPKIVLMVNNSQSLSDKLSRSRDASKGLINKIYGVYEIDKWFNLLLYDLYNSTSIDDFLSKKGTKNKEKGELSPRFHQIFFTQATMRYYKEENYKKFIWGAVPRSGKSYMIGNMISTRRNTKNDIVIILGAKSETESQFIKMFCDFADYTQYGIIKTSIGKMDNIKNCPNLNTLKEKNIYVFSQEWFKNGKIISALNKSLKNKKLSRKGVTDESSIFTNEVLEKYKELLKKGNKIDLYFDEIHKGGSTDNSENILNAFNSAGVVIDIFIMVTATFAKPNIKYKTTFIDTKEPKILEWSYEDQQIMKNIKNDTKMEMMINSRKGIEKEIMREIFEKYKFIYGNDFLDIISKQYERHPELVLLQPYDKIENIDKNFNFKDIFNSNIKCDACFPRQTIDDLRNPSNVFFDVGRINKLIEILIGSGSYYGKQIIHPNSVYGYLKKIGAPDYSEKHSELWFLPDDDLYVDAKKCEDICESSVKKEDNHNEDANEKKSGLPHIEPITRGLAFALMKNEFFQERYNILIVHNTKINYKHKYSDTKITYEEIYKNTNISTTVDSKNLSESIKDFETQTYKEGKNLIILTGAKLRLGISLPCVDIGFNFDNIQSVDVNYQTMFRVLTERYNKPKKYGFYVDFNKNRFINFLYDYNATYSSAKNISNMKENVTHLQGLLLLFNINGFGLQNLDERNELKIYNNLTNELKLNIEGYAKYYSNFENISKLFKKSLIDVEINDLIPLKNLININQKIDKPKNIKTILKEGEKYSAPVYFDETNEDRKDLEDIDNTDENIEENDSNATIINIISDLLPRVVTLLSLFSDINNYDCEELTNCLDKSINKLKKGDNLCNCDNMNSSYILECYFKDSLQNGKLLKILEIIKSLLNNPNYNNLRDTTNFIFNNIREMGKNKNALIYSMSPEDIQKKIEQYLPIREEKKRENGEVFTPIQLIEEMLQQLPSTVWKNPELKWLDPANGIGNFPMIVYKYLLERLPDKYDGKNGSYSTENGKKKHIIENMLYMIEKDVANIKISRKIFGKNANICCADFLDEKQLEKCLEKFGLEKFDIIVGNPPFNASQENEGKKGGGDSLWPKFVSKSISILVNDGYLVFVHPSAWRKPQIEGSKTFGLFDLMAHDNQIEYLEIHDTKDGAETFNKVGTRYDWYVLKKHKNNKYTIIKDQNGNIQKIDLSEWNFLPNCIINDIKKLLGNSDNVIYSRNQYGTDKSWTNEKKTDKFIFPLIHSIPLTGIRYYWSSTKTPDVKNFIPMFGVPKIIFAESGNINDVIVDINGKYGLTQEAIGIKIKNAKEGEQLKKALLSDEFKEVLKAMSFSNYRIDWRMFKYFKSDFYKDFLKKDAGLKIKKFVTKKLRERKNNKTKKTSQKGGIRSTKKHLKKLGRKTKRKY